MTKVPPGEPTVFADDDPDDDTIEMELSPADMQRLSRAAEEQQKVASEAESMPHAQSDVMSAPQRHEPPPNDLSATNAQERPMLTDPAPPQRVPPQQEPPDTAIAAKRRPPRNVRSAAWGALTGAAGALIVVAAISSWSTADRTTQVVTTAPPPPAAAPVAATPPPAATAPQQAPQQTAPIPEAPPVRIKNPFDKSEIFEFPPGTTLKEARHSVADVLMQRARDRKAQPPGLQRSRIARNN